jgi:hypothetical protein
MRTKIDDPARLLKTVNEELSKFDSKLIVTAQRTVFSRLSARGRKAAGMPTSSAA